MKRLKFLGFIIWVIAACFPAAVYAQLSTGAFKLETSLAELAGPGQLSELSAIYADKPLAAWSLFVPERYDPANPPGVLVYISPSKKGSLPRSWHRALEHENLIFISANGAGNKAPTARRLANAVLALRAVNSRYKTNPDRHYLSGFSGGARVSNVIVETMPEVFDGAVFIGGAFKWNGDEGAMAETLKGGSYVFVTGRRDHARPEVMQAYRQYRRVETASVKLIDDRQLGHNLPKAKTFAKALSYLSP